MINKKTDGAVSEIIGTMLLLLIAIIAMSLIYITILSDDGPSPETYVKIVGIVNGPNIILDHQGGESLELDTKISMTIAGIEYNGLVGNWLNDENNNDKWNIGERMIFPFEYDLNRLGDYEEINVHAVDTLSNSIVFMGPMKTKIVSDMGLEIFVDNQFPIKYEHINITIIATSYGGDVNGSGNVKVKYLIPDDLIYINDISTHGTYDNETGIWDVGNVLVGTPAILQIEAQFIGLNIHEPVQLAMILDGSESTHSDKWNLMKEGLKKAIKNEDVFPHDGSVELTVVEYGSNPPRANAELIPTIITEENYASVAQDLRNTMHPRGYSPMSCGLRLGADLVHDVGNFNPNIRQIIILVTDGTPDCSWLPGTYNGTYTNITSGKSSARNARDYLINKLELSEDQDEVDVVAIGKIGVDLPWLNSSIPWPEPSYIAPPIIDSGWINHVEGGWKDFEEAINMILKLLLNSVTLKVELYDSSTIDLNSANDLSVTFLNP